ncbi:hypothetical protein W97_01905 [Coniosporium apollinis CBS 100218]|uniref:CHL4 family chromosome segregation protein n=1 Tax=Coniosporium apollinis (strain CBS 100218) TaxID=1168221 RepID=R7YM32_CONA1|nr:uncharacterized protein W97_01905 [Coniosporium apollinis CBS 100218]EON62681.1 hypothetical protein W97_01905 [Coniosporium apollinis CBS 100218]
MAPRKPTAVPTTAALPHSHRLPPSSPDVLRTLSRLSRPTLISLAVEWLEEKNRDFCAPFLADDGSDIESRDELYTVAHSYEELQETYEELGARKGGKRQVIDRITEGDWRHGVSLYQLAMADTRYLLDHPTSLRWNALRLARVGTSEGASSEVDHLPRFHADTYLRNLQREVAPLAKAHYYITKLKTMPITLLRVQIHDTPYNTPQITVQHPSALTLSQNTTSETTTKSLFAAFPTGSPFIYISLATSVGQSAGSDSRSLRSLIVDAIPKALSRPQCRYVLKTTSLSARSLEALLSLRGPGRSNEAAGGWSIFAEHKGAGVGVMEHVKRPAPAQATKQSQSQQQGGHGDGANAGIGAPETRPKGLKRARQDSAISPGVESPASKRRRLVAEGRFGCSGLPDDGKGIERFDVRIEDAFPDVPEAVAAAGKPGMSGKKVSSKGTKALLDPGAASGDEHDEAAAPADANASNWTPDVRFSFQGAHVFAGIRQLVGSGVVDGEKMPGWMTGEAGVSVGAVNEGRIMVKEN